MRLSLGYGGGNSSGGERISCRMRSEEHFGYGGRFLRGGDGSRVRWRMTLRFGRGGFTRGVVRGLRVGVSSIKEVRHKKVPRKLQYMQYMKSVTKRCPTSCSICSI